MAFYGIYFADGKSKVVGTWEECKSLVLGVSGVRHKSFSSHEELVEWFDTLNKNSKEPPKCKLEIYVDGSFEESVSEHAAWGWIAVQNDVAIAQNNGLTKIPAKSRNIDGELAAVMRAVTWWKNNYPDESACIFYDFQGIAAWLNGEWQTKSEVAKLYCQFMKPFMESKKLFFKKVVGHSGDKWNEEVDQLTYAAFYPQGETK